MNSAPDSKQTGRASTGGGGSRDGPIEAALAPFPWVSEQTVARLKIYCDLLVAWQARHNLIANSTLDQVWVRHFADSLQLLPLVPDMARSWLDLGSGAGFPGLVIAIAAADRQPMAVTLVESQRKKCAFLRAVATATDTEITIVNARIEDYALACDTPFDVVSARALAPLDTLFALVAPFGTATNQFLLPKGQDFVCENKIASKSWCYDLVSVDSVTDPNGLVAVVTNLKPKGPDHE
ncbi:MAG: 16S rRNA (guanine(527)-N(7))-methyltransferase RsmG [Alphaproteobacteria bacterium]